LQRSSVVAILGWILLLLAPQTGNTQGSSCQLSIAGDGSSSASFDISGCAGDTVAVVVGAGGNQKQFPIGPGPDLSVPYNISQCDLDISGDRAVGLSYTLVVISGPDKGKASTTYTGTLNPDPSRPGDAPPTISFDSWPHPPGSYVRPDDAIALTVNAGDDVAVTEVKVTDPDGKMVLDKRPPPPPRQSKCHPRGHSVRLEIPKPYIVPENPPVPVIRFTAVARDSAGHETPAVAEYFTVATWNGLMLLDGKSTVPNNDCDAKWRVDVTLKTTPSNEVTGTAEARHPPVSCSKGYAGSRDTGDVIAFAVTGTFDGKSFTLFFNATRIGGSSPAWGIGGLHLLQLPSPAPIELKADSARQHADGRINLSNPGNVEGKNATSALSGTINLQCCFSEAPPTALPKSSPLFLGDDNQPDRFGGDR